MNGDARPDALIGAYGAGNNARTGSGSAYVVFGKTTTTPIDLAALGTQGYRIDGAAASDGTGRTVAAAGDVNGDGRPDALVGADNADNNLRSNSGSVYVVFGKTTTTPIDLASLGLGGYRIDGAAADDWAGYSLANGGDVNGDGRPDALVGAYGADYNGRASSGSVYVVFGKTVATPTDLAVLLPTDGYRIDGAAASDRAYTSANAGDVNGDGRSDSLVGATGADNNGRSGSGSVYVVFGEATSSGVDLASLGTNGYRIDGAAANDSTGKSLANAGDVNGDGRPDALVTADFADYNSRASSGSVYVVFGKTSTSALDLATLGTGGYRLDGAAASDSTGNAVASAGDVNGDGRTDFLVGAYRADNNGRTDSGSAYVVHGPTCGYRDTLLTTSGLGNYWRFGETSGATAADSKGSDAGAYTGGITLGADPAFPGETNKAASLDGVDDYVGVADVRDFASTAAFSIEAWINRTTTNESALRRIVDKRENAAPIDGWTLALAPAGEAAAHKLVFERYGAGVGTRAVATTFTQPGTWYHVVAAYDGSSMKIYVNGVLEASVASSVSVGDHGLPLRIGASADGGGHFGGTIDEAAVYTRALTAAEVADHYGMR